MTVLCEDDTLVGYPHGTKDTFREFNPSMGDFVYVDHKILSNVTVEDKMKSMFLSVIHVKYYPPMLTRQPSNSKI